MNCDDVFALQYHQWAICDDYYPLGRDLLQHSMMNIFCFSTTARAGTVVESSCYHGTNEALTYGDIKLLVVPDTGYPGKVTLALLVQLRLLKGKRNRGNP